MIIIDGVTYDIAVLSMRRKGEFLFKFAERTANGVLHSELIGVYFNYELTLSPGFDTTEYAALWTKLTEAEEFHTVTVPFGDGTTRTFSAYFANVADEIKRVTGTKTFYKNLTVNFISQSPAVT